MFDLFNSYDIGKLQSKIAELEARVKQLESLNGIEFKLPVNERIKQVNGLTEEEFSSLTDLMSKSQKELQEIKVSDVPKKALDCFYELSFLAKEDQTEFKLFKEAIRDRQVNKMNDFIEMMTTGKMPGK